MYLIYPSHFHSLKTRHIITSQNTLSSIFWKFQMMKKNHPYLFDSTLWPTISDENISIYSLKSKTSLFRRSFYSYESFQKFREIKRLHFRNVTLISSKIFFQETVSTRRINFTKKIHFRYGKISVKSICSTKYVAIRKLDFTKKD